MKLDTRMPVTNLQPRPGIGRRLIGLYQLSHPLPTAMWVVAITLFSLVAAAAAHRPPQIWKLLLVMVGIGCAYTAIGAANDYFDQELDAKRTDKPIPQGLVTPGHAIALAVATTVGVVAAFASLGLVPLLLGLLIEGMGMSYNVGLKRTIASGLVFAVWFPIIPFLAWTVFGVWQPFLPWLVVAGAALGIEINVSNTVPDLEDDIPQGVRGLAHTLGLQRSLALTWIVPIALVTLFWILDLTGRVPAHPVGLAVATVAAVASTAAAAALVARRPIRSRLRSAFIIQTVGALVLAASWMAAAAL